MLLALAATPFLVRAASVLALTGPGSLRALYPWLVLLQAHASTLRPALHEQAGQAVLWLQFPTYGLLISLLKRQGSLAAAFAIVALLHALAFLLASFWT